MRFRFKPALPALLALLFVAASHAGEIRVSAAASLSDVMKSIAAAYEKQSGDTVALNLGASSTLARQIEEGAPADVFFSADEAQMDRVAQQGRIVGGTRKSLLSNTLVVVVTADSKLVLRQPSDLAAVRRLALGDPTAVPAGVYAKEYLTKLGLWEQIAPKVVSTASVRGTLAAVESGNVEAGIVYRTDAAISDKVKVAWRVPAQEGPLISYPVALIAGAKSPEAARAFIKHLEGPEAARIFEKFGFDVLE